METLILYNLRHQPTFSSGPLILSLSHKHLVPLFHPGPMCQSCFGCPCPCQSLWAAQGKWGHLPNSGMLPFACLCLVFKMMFLLDRTSGPPNLQDTLCIPVPITNCWDPASSKKPTPATASTAAARVCGSNLRLVISASWEWCHPIREDKTTKTNSWLCLTSLDHLPCWQQCCYHEVLHPGHTNNHRHKDHVQWALCVLAVSCCVSHP